MERIHIITLGCSKNKVDSEYIAGILDGKYKITEDIYKSDIVIINTCTFIKDAKEESIEEIFNVIRLKEKKIIKKIILAGCLSQRYSKQLSEEIPEIDMFIGTSNYDKIELFLKEEQRLLNVSDPSSEISEKLPRYYGESKHYAYVKIAEGCNNMCTYCIIPKIRGKYRSRKMEEIISEIRLLSENGVKEIILIAQDTGKYGTDIYGEKKLHELVNEISKLNGVKIIRIHYLYPEDIYTKLLIEIAENEKIAKYFDIPIQHINDGILKKMNRKITRSETERKINDIRKFIPDATIRTTVITGFPGETETQHEELKNFIRNTKFDKLGVFEYSREEETPAAIFPNQVHHMTKKRRRREIMEIQLQISESKTAVKRDRVCIAIIDEKTEEELYLGRTMEDSPEIDGYVFVKSSESLMPGDIVKVLVQDSTEYDLIGEYYESCE